MLEHIYFNNPQKMHNTIRVQFILKFLSYLGSRSVGWDPLIASFHPDIGVTRFYSE